jgi:hypothetical protein
LRWADSKKVEYKSGKITYYEITDKIDKAFSDMKQAVDICPKKFRNEMALRLVLSGYH